MVEYSHFCYVILGQNKPIYLIWQLLLLKITGLMQGHVRSRQFPICETFVSRALTKQLAPKSMVGTAGALS